MAVVLQRQVDPAAVPTMIAGTATSDMRLHPFFTTPRAAKGTEEQTTTTDDDSATPNNENLPTADQNHDPLAQEVTKQRKRKSTKEIVGDAPEKRKRGRPRKTAQSPPCSTTDLASASDELQTTSTLDIGQRQHESLKPAIETFHDVVLGVLPPPPGTESAGVATPASSAIANGQSDSTKPKKMLYFNVKSGTLGSPPKPKESPLKAAQDTKTGKSRGAKKESLMLCVKYGADEDSRVRIGDRINEILGAPSPAAPSEAQERGTGALGQTTQPDQKPIEAKNAAISKPTHPFFLGKNQKASVSAEPRGADEASASKPSTPTPGSLKRSRATTSDTPRASNSSNPTFGVRHGGLKVPGARLPAWPWKGLAHIGREAQLPPNTSGPTLSLPSRKSKGNATQVGDSESILADITSSLNIQAIIEEVRNANSDDFLPAPPELRLPRKHCESGRKLQLRIQDNLRATRTNPGLAQLFDSVKTELSAHDRSQFESASWTQKYAPTSAAEVLQAEKETSLLKEWLVALRVQSVDTGVGDAPAPLGRGGPRHADSAKKKRKRNKLEGFVVSSDDEADDLAEISDSDNVSPVPNRSWATKKTVIRTKNTVTKGGKEAPRLRNAVVISGPHGCGKTAAVYAVAKELGFEVFEISPSSRRSGKDILEKIGDMTRNHLVQQHQSGAAPVNAEGYGNLPADDKAAKEVQSGKQATMGSFFKPKVAAKPNAKKPRAEIEKDASAPNQETESKKPAPKSQRQSLILVEEVDILYEEDKQFWPTLIGLIAQSKRPFVMTCNDESLVPLQSLNLHGIFRFNAPPTHVAVDRLLIMAAREGHVLDRGAIEALYESRGRDLRAAITELNYWCQMGVGDRKGGFDWFYLRWPKGIDLDENRDVVRVISEDTYQEGMGWLGRSAESDVSSNPLCQEMDLLQQTWDQFGLDLGLWQDSPAMEHWANNLNTVTNTPSRRVEALEAYEIFAEAMSVADLNSAMAPVGSQQIRIDPTLPSLPAKAKDDFLLGLTPVEVDPIASFDLLDTSISISLKALARHQLWSATDKHGLVCAQYLSAPREEQAAAAIRNRLVQAPPSALAIDRLDFAMAFDVIAVSDEAASGASASYLDPSVWDRTMKIITLDVAPFVRGIVAYDNHLQRQRLKLGNLISQGGRVGPKKKMRTTRAAYSALEGGSRSATRAERWFKADLNPFLVSATAPRGCIAEPEQAPGPQVPSSDEITERSSSAEAELMPPFLSDDEAGVTRQAKRKPPRPVVEESSDADCDGETDDELSV